MLLDVMGPGGAIILGLLILVVIAIVIAVISFVTRQILLKIKKQVEEGDE